MISLILLIIGIIGCFFYGKKAINTPRIYNLKIYNLIIFIIIIFMIIFSMQTQSVIDTTERHNKLLLSQQFNNIELNPYNLLPCEAYKELKASQDSLYDGLIVRMATKYQDKIDEMYKECN